MIFGPWIPPRLFEGQTVVLIGSGKSLNSGDVRYCRDRAPVIAINDNFKMAPWCDVIYGADAAWWKLRRTNLDGLRALRVGLAWDGVARKYYPGWNDDDLLDWVNVLGCSGIGGLERDRQGFIRHGAEFGNNSGYQALQLAIDMGANKILLLGFDMLPGRWFGDYPGGVNKNCDRKLMIEQFVALSRSGVLEEVGVGVVNCSPGSAMNCFPIKEIGEVL